MALLNKIDEIIELLEREVPNAEVSALFTLQGELMTRIFNEGKDSQDKKIGNYKLGAYKNKRQKKGYQVAKVDLQFKGDLFGSIAVGQLNGVNVLGFNSSKEAKIAGYNEERYSKQIFAPTKTEIENCNKEFTLYLQEKLKEKFATW